MGWISVGVTVVATVAAMLIWQTSRGGGEGTPAPDALTHIHGLGINPADGKLHVATHDGLYRLPAGGGPPTPPSAEAARGTSA